MQLDELKAEVLQELNNHPYVRILLDNKAYPDHPKNQTVSNEEIIDFFTDFGHRLAIKHIENYKKTLRFKASIIGSALISGGLVGLLFSALLDTQRGIIAGVIFAGVGASKKEDKLLLEIGNAVFDQVRYKAEEYQISEEDLIGRHREKYKRDFPYRITFY